MDPYIYPGTSILRNKFDIRDPAVLEKVERRLTLQSAREGIPTGNFDLVHLKAVHRHLFQDIHDWAGEIRTVEISKGGTQFMTSRYITTGMDDVHRRIVAAQYFRGETPKDFAAQARSIIGDVNHMHINRES